MDYLHNMQKLNNIKLTDFFGTDYVDFSSYDNLRKISSLVDGQKNASRKILYTILEKNVKDKIKVSQLGSKISEFSEYLHGSLDNVVINMAKSFPGTNNIALLESHGNFGTRFSPDASAPRYIYANGSKEFFEYFKKEDMQILKQQEFEGNLIEPRFYVPTIPILLVNGSEGVSSGFAQKILPRNPMTIKSYLKAVLNNKKVPKLIPYYNGFNGTITHGINPGQWYINGTVKKLGVNKVLITELPIGYDLMGYLKVLDSLEDKKLIRSYKDKSEDDIFKFEVSINSKLLASWSNEELLSVLKLTKTVTENYTVLDENNKIKVFDSAEEIIDAFIKVKLQYLDLRKTNQVSVLTESIKLDYSKYLFIKNIVQETLKINKRKKINIIQDLNKLPDIIKKDNSYDYLLNMNILSLTEERMQKLEADIKSTKTELTKLSNTNIKSMWLAEL